MLSRLFLSHVLPASLSTAAIIGIAGCAGSAPAVAPTPIIVVATTVPEASPTPSPTKIAPTVAPTITAPSPAAELPRPTAAVPSTSDRLKPVTTPTTAPIASTNAPTSGKKSKFLIPSAAKIVPAPLPTAVRKGVASPNVNPEQYAKEILADLQIMSDSLSNIGKVIDSIENAGELSEADQAKVLAAFQKEADAIRAAYNREVARDYPPQLKEIDDYYVESIRYASRTVDTVLKLLQTGDESLLSELETNLNKFQFFVNELLARAQRL